MDLETETPMVTPRSLAEPSPRASSVAETVPPSPSHGVWHTEPASIDVPLVLLDEQQAEQAATIAQLRAELQILRAERKAEQAEREELKIEKENLELELGKERERRRRLEQENGFHHGIRAADWEQTLDIQARLRQEEAAHERLAMEAADYRSRNDSLVEEAVSLRTDASRWRLLAGASASKGRSSLALRGPARSEEEDQEFSALQDVSSLELCEVLEITAWGVARLHAEQSKRSRLDAEQLRCELDQQLCVVCKDERKTVLFLPCSHICVCEVCRGRLSPYRCPMCQEPVKSHIARCHF